MSTRPRGPPGAPELVAARLAGEAVALGWGFRPSGWRRLRVRRLAGDGEGEEKERAFAEQRHEAHQQRHEHQKVRVEEDTAQHGEGAFADADTARRSRDDEAHHPADEEGSREDRQIARLDITQEQRVERPRQERHPEEEEQVPEAGGQQFDRACHLQAGKRLEQPGQQPAEVAAERRDRQPPERQDNGDHQPFAEIVEHLQPAEGDERQCRQRSGQQHLQGDLEQAGGGDAGLRPAEPGPQNLTTGKMQNIARQVLGDVGLAPDDQCLARRGAGVAGGLNQMGEAQRHTEKQDGIGGGRDSQEQQQPVDRQRQDEPRIEREQAFAEERYAQEGKHSAGRPEKTIAGQAAFQRC
jgi:hypothetical protein